MKALLPILFLAISLNFSIPSTAQNSEKKVPFQSAETLVEALYDAVTFEAGTTPDWDYVRSMFLQEAVIILRTHRDSTSVFSLEGFVGDFVRFIEESEVEKTGFQEKIVRMKPMIFGDMAQFLVLYEVSIPGWGRPPQQGVDNFLLNKRDGRWWIVAITNEVPTKDRPLPELLRGD